MSVAVFLVAMSVVCAGICYAIAKRKFASIPFWIVMAALFGPLAVLFILCVKSSVADSQ